MKFNMTEEKQEQSFDERMFRWQQKVDARNKKYDQLKNTIIGFLLGIMVGYLIFY